MGVGFFDANISKLLDNGFACCGIGYQEIKSPAHWLAHPCEYRLSQCQVLTSIDGAAQLKFYSD
jgi:hypothetical protein